MAVITNLVTILGNSEAAERPYTWHVFDVFIPFGVLSGGTTVDDIHVANFPSGTRCLQAGLVVEQAGSTSAGTCTFETEIYGYNPGDASRVDITNLNNATNLLAADTYAGLVQNAEVLSSFGPTFQDGSEAPGTYKPGVGFEITPAAAAVFDGDARIVLSMLLGRSEY